MTIEELTKEDIEHIEKMWEVRQRGLYYTSEIITRIYNKILGFNATNTNCGTCLKRRVDSIHAEYERIKNLTEPSDNGTEIKQS